MSDERLGRFMKRNGLPAPKNTKVTTEHVAAWLERHAKGKLPGLAVKMGDLYGDALAYKLGVAEEVIRVLLNDRNRFWHVEYRKQMLGKTT